MLLYVFIRIFFYISYFLIIYSINMLNVTLGAICVTNSASYVTSCSTQNGQKVRVM